MNNFVFSQDPLLYQSSFPRISEELSMKQQMDETYLKYKAMQEQYKNLTKPENEPVDRVKELNDTLYSLSPEISEKVAKNENFTELNNALQKLIQTEILETVKWKINNNPKAEQNIVKQLEIINSIKKRCEEEDRRNMSELNDYMKNYSNMTFDEYKRIKNGENNNEDKKSSKK